MQRLRRVGPGFIVTGQRIERGLEQRVGWVERSGTHRLR
jgi:hypothetical protein